MLERLLGLENAQQITYFEWYLRRPWPITIVLLLIVCAAAYAAWSYSRTGTLSRFGRAALIAIRAVLLGIIILLLFEPVFGVEMNVKLRRLVLILVDDSASMRINDQRREARDLHAAALALGEADFGQAQLALPRAARQAARRATRTDIARGILTNEQLRLIDRLDENFKVRTFRFSEGLQPLGAEGDNGADADGPIDQRLSADGEATRLGAAIDEAVNRYAGQPIAGLILLTDGASNKGVDPVEVARRMRDRSIPLYPVGIGLPDPPDVAINSMLVQEIVFAGDRVPIRLQIGSSGYAGRSVKMTLSVDGAPIDSRDLALTGGPQFAQMIYEPGQVSGMKRLRVDIEPLADETTTANNAFEQTVRVIDEKIKVLYVEGKPRWEFRYLRRVLERDRRLDVKFLMTEGDRDLARHSDQYIERFPEVAGEAFRFDLVILGDVPATIFTPRQMQRMTELVKNHTGSLLMLAGRRHAPQSYADTLIEPLLPVRLVGRRGAEWQPIRERIHPRVTPAGRISASASLETPQQRNDAIWRLVSPMHELPRLEGAKAGANVLVTLSDAEGRDEAYPLIAWQRYGTGKCMFVGTDQLWRMRFKRGDKYHARFWGQTIQFLTLSRLLGGNKRIHVETDRRSYSTGDRVQVFAHVLNENFEPARTDRFSVFIERVGPLPESVDVELEADPRTPGLFRGFVPAEQSGRFRIRVADDLADVANTVEYEVKAVTLEQREPAMQQPLLENLAALSGGRYVRIADLPQLADGLEAGEKTTVVRREKELFDLPAVFILVLALAATEWFFRRRRDLV